MASMAATFAVSVGVADIRREPDPSAELVTQALMNMSAVAGEVSDAWTYVTLPDYSGWIHSDELAEPVVKGFCKIGEHCATPLDLVAVVRETHAPLYVDATGNEELDTLYLSTTLPLLDTTRPECLQVALPGACAGWISRQAVDIRRREDAYQRAGVAVVTEHARAFLGVPYLWGGTCWQGIDCSGLVQVCYRMGGYLLPRDADQQHDALPGSVAREDIQEGDLIFFGAQHITHVALALNHKGYIHAEGVRYGRVLVNSFDVTHAHYDERLATLVRAIKRVVT
ncbi:MAG TPA: C40 family peptidase [Ktedonobacteraceae bacterium]|nr:C40 family peptidase [Ktedonobacteraceae bacterium]